MSKLTASVVLCTYQGERFLGEQLESLRTQTRMPLEIVAQDDASTDGTWALLESRRGALPLRLHRNPKRLGFAANFASALTRARGDVIFLCDQDDVWEPAKIEVLMRRFEEDPALLVACTEASRIDEASAPLGGHVLAGNGLGPTERERWAAGEALPGLVRANPVPGMTMAFRASLRSAALPLPPGWEHDYWILLAAAGMGKAIAVDPEPRARYRQHGGQVIGGTTLRGRLRRAQGPLAARNEDAKRWEALYDRLRAIDVPARNLELVKAKAEHLARRGALREGRLARVAGIAGELFRGGYHRYDAGFSSALKDLLSS